MLTSQMIADPSSGGIGSRGFVHGESLTDDFKEAVANSASAFHAVQVHVDHHTDFKIHVSSVSLKMFQSNSAQCNFLILKF